MESVGTQEGELIDGMWVQGSGRSSPVSTGSCKSNMTQFDILDCGKLRIQQQLRLPQSRRRGILDILALGHLPDPMPRAL